MPRVGKTMDRKRVLRQIACARVASEADALAADGVLSPISRGVRVYTVPVAGRSIGTINAHNCERPHAMDDRSVCHYADTVAECVAWLRERAS